MVSLRTSFLYVWLAIALPIMWVVLHRLNVLHIDNNDMTYLNLTLSILAEVQGVVLLIYTTRIAATQRNSSRERKSMIRKMARIHAVVDKLETDLEEVDEELGRE